MGPKIYSKNITIGFIYIQITVAILTYFLLSLIKLTDITMLTETIALVLITTTFFYLLYNGKIIIDINGLQIDRCWYPIDKINSIHISYMNTDYSGTIALLDIHYYINTIDIWEKRIQLSSYDKEIEDDLKKWCTINKIPLQIKNGSRFYRND